LSKTEKQKMLAGELYRPGSSELQADAAANKKWLVRYNAAMALPVSERHAPALLNDPRSSAFSRYSSRSDVAEKFVNFGP
jgi:hypothetical protein